MFTEEDRQIYILPDGRRCDPLSIRRRLLIGTAGQINPLLDTIEKGTDLETAEAQEKLLPAIRGAFNLKPIDANGDTDAMAFKILDHYLKWLNGVKKNGLAKAISRPCTDCPPLPNQSHMKPS
jgi:hypothetical protein